VTAARPALLAGLLLACAPGAAAAQAPFFRSDTVFAITLRTDLHALYRDRDTTGVPWREGSVTWTDAGGSHTVPVRVRTRGVFRLGRCDVPPIRLRFRENEVAGTALDSLRRPKLATHCMNSSTGEQNLLQEYAIYRVYQRLTPWAYAVRLLRITYEDTTGRERTQTRWGFVIEDGDRFAERMHAEPDTAVGRRLGELGPERAAFLGVFQYFIANTDWSMPYLHNIDLYRTGDSLWAVPYDFDWSGVVDAAYARPDRRLPIHSVRQRIFRGICESELAFASSLAQFQALRDSLPAVYHAVPGLEPRNAERTLRYYDEFYRDIADLNRFGQDVVSRGCQPQ